MDNTTTLTQTTSQHTTAVNTATVNSNSNITPVLTTILQSDTLPTVVRSPSTASSLVNLFDGFTARVSGSNSSDSNTVSTVPAAAGSSTGSLVSLTSIGSLGTTANAFYSSIGLAFNSLTLPITAAAAAATATTAEAAGALVAAASAISNHLSSPTNGSPPNEGYTFDDDDDDEDDDDDCDDDDEGDQRHRHVPAHSTKKTWAEIKTAVNDMRKQMSNMSSLVPTNIQFRTLSDGRVRCYFLSTPPSAWETTLLYADINISHLLIYK